MSQTTLVPFTLNVVASIEGLNNFHRGDVVDEEDHEYATALGGLLSRTIGDRAALYGRHRVEHTAGRIERARPADAGRVRVGSWTPRASGFRPGVSLKTFGIEKRLRGHLFQLNVSNSLGTTVSEMARTSPAGSFESSSSGL